MALFNYHGNASCRVTIGELRCPKITFVNRLKICRKSILRHLNFCLKISIHAMSTVVGAATAENLEVTSCVVHPACKKVGGGLLALLSYWSDVQT